jgi:cysteine desulfurase
VIYVDNAATTQLDSDAYEAMKPYLIYDYGNASSAYSFARNPKKALKKARSIIASSINTNSENIFFTSGGTESDNWAIKGIAFAQCKKGKHIITSQIEHHAILNSCAFLESLGFDITYLPVDKSGYVLPTSLEKAIRKDTILVSIMLANNEIGTIQNIKELVAIAHAHGIIFHTDAVQGVGHIHINVSDLNVDLLSASAHKFNGPKGIGFLYKKNDVNMQPYVHGGIQESQMRAGTENIAGIVGMSVALEKNTRNIEYHTKILWELSNTILCELKQNHVDFILNGDAEKRLPGHLSLSFRGQDGEAIMHRLDLKGILISTGAACNSKEIGVSHVIKAISVPKEYAKGTIRITFGKNNTQNEALQIAHTLIKILKT